MISKTIALLLMVIFAAFSLVACGISADVHDAAVAEKEAAQASVAQLELENESVKTDLAKAQETVQNLNAVYPPRRFEDRSEIEVWLRNDDISERADASLAEGLLSKALEQQARALENGYIISAAYWGPDEDFVFVVWLSAVTRDLDYFVWNPESDEVMFATNTNQLE
jgi:hypothetical protein